MADHHLPADATCNMFTIVFQVLAVIIDTRVKPFKNVQCFLLTRFLLTILVFSKPSNVSTFRYEILFGEVNIYKKQKKRTSKFAWRKLNFIF